MGAGSSMVEDEPPTRAPARTLNASYKLDGEAVARTSQSNVIENAIPGVRLTLKGITASPMSVTTTPAAIDTDAVDQEGPGARRRVQRRRHRHAHRADREERPEGDDVQRPQDGHAVRRLRPDLDARLAQEPDDPGRHRPRPHGPRRHRHHRAQVHGRRGDRGRQGRQAELRHRPSSPRPSTPTTRRSATCSPARAPRRASRA